MQDEGKKTVLVTMPVSIWKALKSAAYSDEMKIASWVRCLIIHELNRRIDLKENKK